MEKQQQEGTDAALNVGSARPVNSPWSAIRDHPIVLLFGAVVGASATTIGAIGFLNAHYVTAADHARETNTIEHERDQLREATIAEKARAEAESRAAQLLRDECERQRRRGDEADALAVRKDVDLRELKLERDTLQKRVAELETASITLKQQIDELEPLRQKVAQLDSLFAGVLASPARVKALQRYSTTPSSGWSLYGEPCHDHAENKHPAMHNSGFTLVGASNRPPQVGDLAIVDEFLTVWQAPPQRDREDCHGRISAISTLMDAELCEYYPPEATDRGVLVPGQRVRVKSIFPITLGPTFIQFELVEE